MTHLPTQKEIEIHNSIERIKDKVRDYNNRYDSLTDREKNRLMLLELRLKQYLITFEKVELYWGILL